MPAIIFSIFIADSIYENWGQPAMVYALIFAPIALIMLGDEVSRLSRKL